MDNLNLQNQIVELQKNLEALKGEFYRNNFISSQDFTKYSRFNNRLKVPHMDTLPTTCEQGEVFEYSGNLYICSAQDTPTVVGTQS